MATLLLIVLYLELFISDLFKHTFFNLIFSYIHHIYFSLTAMGKLEGSRGLSGVLGGSPGAYRGQFYWEKVMSFGLRIIIETLA